MGNIYEGHDCGQQVRRGEARVRSINFEQVYFCQDCWAARHPVQVPAPRPAPNSSTVPGRR